MEILKPYETASGKMTNTKPIVDALLKYIINNSIGSELAYEFYQGDVELYIITGKNADEKSLPIFNFPLFFKNIRNKDCVAIDLRPFISHSLLKEDIIELRPIMRDSHGANVLLLTALLLVKEDREPGLLKPLITNIISAMSILLTNSLTRVTPISIETRRDIEIATAIYAYSLMFRNNRLYEDQERLTNFLLKIKLIVPIDRRTLISKLELLQNLDNSLYGIQLLKELILLYIPDDLKDILTVNALFTTLDSGWYGPGGNSTLFASLECMPLFVVLLYTTGVTSMYKTSKFARILDENQRKFNRDEIIKFINNSFIKKDFGSLL